MARCRHCKGEFEQGYAAGVHYSKCPICGKSLLRWKLGITVALIQLILVAIWYYYSSSAFNEEVAPPLIDVTDLPSPPEAIPLK